MTETRDEEDFSPVRSSAKARAKAKVKAKAKAKARTKAKAKAQARGVSVRSRPVMPSANDDDEAEEDMEPKGDMEDSGDGETPNVRGRRESADTEARGSMETPDVELKTSPGGVETDRQEDGKAGKGDGKEEEGDDDLFSEWD